jgi:hypothetical protein
MYSPEPFRIYVHDFYCGNGEYPWEGKQVITVGTFGCAWAQTYELNKMHPPCGVTCYQLDLWVLGRFIKCLFSGNLVLCFNEWWLNPNA